MTKEEVIKKIKECKTMPELDALRLETVKAMNTAGKTEGASGFYGIQKAFIKKKNQLKRIPLRDRTW